ncbi:hypothetical protein K458DRAFT_422150 [Lentithecium fluviatile CBS 122367]|uniref:Uncharacterized protein n=1 Tax=Lentithecium fluviatile CBS 122367 TaxID=1168545 RepID=A0A6G1IMX0_9PLEO|nr:hypothetical protein K458DRAFT_422150 [Lentithecium fluviatile CBS 122367]
MASAAALGTVLSVRFWLHPVSAPSRFPHRICLHAEFCRGPAAPLRLDSPLCTSARGQTSESTNCTHSHCDRKPTCISCIPSDRVQPLTSHRQGPPVHLPASFSSSGLSSRITPLTVIVPCSQSFSSLRLVLYSRTFPSVYLSLSQNLSLRHYLWFYFGRDPRRRSPICQSKQKRCRSFRERASQTVDRYRTVVLVVPRRVRRRECWSPLDAIPLKTHGNCVELRSFSGLSSRFW